MSQCQWQGMRRCDASWAHIDPTLWNMAFTGHARVKRCKFCFALTHQSEDCDLAPATSQSPATNQAGVTPACKKQKQVCYSYNYTEGDQCEFGPSCKFMHICLNCARDPLMPAADKRHKVKYCSHQRRAPGRVALQHAPPPATGRYHPYQ